MGCEIESDKLRMIPRFYCPKTGRIEIPFTEMEKSGGKVGFRKKLKILVLLVYMFT